MRFNHSMECGNFSVSEMVKIGGVSFTCEFSPNFDLNFVDLSWKKNDPKFARFRSKINPNRQIFMISSTR
jgi:hypothetical protein